MYFVTVCTHQRRCSLGHVVNDAVRLTEAGRIVTDSWLWLAGRYPYVTLDMFVIMPNHLHGLIAIDRDAVACATDKSTQHQKSLGSLVGAFKTVATRQIHTYTGTPHECVWQRGFYEHVMRGLDSLAAIQEYIESNPARWMLDEENPDHRR